MFKQKIRQGVKKILAKSLQPYGFSIDGIKPTGNYLSAHELNYKAKGFSNLREYFQKKWGSNVQTRCDSYVQKFFKHRLSGNEVVIEIGTGVGFFTYSLFNQFPKLKYFSFELDKNLEKYLNKEFQNFNFSSLPCIGNKLDEIENSSVDVIIGFGIFTYVNFSNLMQYLIECVRVCKKGGYIFFDIFDTDILSIPLLNMFEDYSLQGNNRPFISGKLLMEILAQKGFSLIDSLQENNHDPKQYYSHKLLFQKN